MDTGTFPMWGGRLARGFWLRGWLGHCRCTGQVSQGPMAKGGGRGPASHHPTKSVVLLVQDRFPVPAQAFKEFAIGFNHLIQAANVGMHVVAPQDDPRQVFLNISPQTWPVGGAAAEGWQILKIRMTRGQIQKFRVVVDIALDPIAE